MTATVKAYKGMGMEGSTARWYDRTTRKDLPEIKSLAVRIAGAIPSSAHVLEVAPGPGFLSIELAKRGLSVQALDISKTFVEMRAVTQRRRGWTSASTWATPRPCRFRMQAWISWCAAPGRQGAAD